jgi:hypothetical protein
MPPASDSVTRATRLAANVAAASVMAFAVLWVLTTQFEGIRALSPIADDPRDAFASYAAIFLPVVAGATWIRSLSHHGRLLPQSTARRIRWGSGLAAAIVFAAGAADLQATLTIGWRPDAGINAVLLTALIGLTLAASLGAVVLVARAAMVARAATVAAASAESNAGMTPEPDVLDDLLDLATDVARPLGLGRAVERLASAIERFLDGSAMSPRRHRLLFGVVLALAAAVAFDVWQAIREGPWASLIVPVIFGALLAGGVLAIYLGTLGPLRLLRPPTRN